MFPKTHSPIFCEKQLIPNDETLIIQKPLFSKKYKILFILFFNDVFPTIFWNCIRIDAMLPVLSSFIQLYPHKKSVNFQKLRLLKNRYFTPLRLKHPLSE